MTAREVYNEITSYLATNFGTDYIHYWYVGIASDVEQRLFGDHMVDRNGLGWVFREAFDASHAREAETMLLNRGHDGGTGGGDHTTVFVYAFRKVPGTIR